MRRIVRYAVLSLALLGATPAPPDPYLSHLTGKWNVSGTILGKPVHQSAQARWVLDRQFLLLHFEGAYSADVYIGYDPVRKRYVEHWLDVTGAAGATAVGFGERNGLSITFCYAYLDGPFTNAMTYDPATDTWRIHYATQDSSRRWRTFGDETLARPSREAAAP